MNNPAAVNPPQAAPVRSRLEELMSWAGIIIMMAAVIKTTVIVAAVMLMTVSPQAGIALLLMALPTWTLTALGAGGLIFYRRWGFYLIYTALALTLFALNNGGLSGFSLLPWLDRLLRFGALTPYCVFAANLVFVLLLAVLHAALFSKTDLLIQNKIGLGVMGTVLVCLVGYGVTSSRFEFGDGPFAAPASLPHVGGELAAFSSQGPVDCHYIWLPSRKGLSMVFTGLSPEPNIQSLAAKLKLTAIGDQQYQQKMLGLLKSWKLEEGRFPGRFENQDLYYSGRLNAGRGRAVLQICWRRADQRFTAQIMGADIP